VQRVSLRRLVSGEPPEPDRIFFTSLWFRGHNNPRYAELLPRLGRLDGFLLVMADRRIPRGLEYRAYRWSTRVRLPLQLRYLGRRHRSLFTADNEQIPWFRGPAVSDVDDPAYDERHVGLLNHPNLAAYVVTAEHAARRYEAMGVDKPWHVIPQGVSLRSVTPELVADAACRRTNGEVVVGYMAAFLLTAADRDGANELYNVDHLLELWDDVHRAAPEARLWLVGNASEHVRRRTAGRDDIIVTGLLSREQALAHAANFDVALYPRTRDRGIRAAKVSEYIGLGVPTVSYDYEVTANLRETGAGVLVASPREFVDAVVGLVHGPEQRAEIAAAARKAGAELDWDVLARRYETEILDRHLPAR
jgi:glycosyltransferase involved in cell wall biosynthesis